MDGDGTIAELRFRILDYPGNIPSVEIAEGISAYAGGSIRSIPSRSLDLLPDGPSLYPNYPNPFNIETVIEYGLRDPGLVHLDIFNILGQRVIELVNTHHEGGIYSARWDGRDHFGRVVASGVYFSRLEIKGEIRVKKMLLLK